MLAASAPLFPVYFLMTSHMTPALGVFDSVHSDSAPERGGDKYVPTL